MFPSLRSQPASSSSGVKPHKVSLYDTRATLDPETYVPQLANTLAPWTASTAAQTTDVAGRAAAMDADTGLYNELNKQALADLNLGGALNDDEIRQATQGSRAAYAARGMTNSGRGILGEVMARAQFSNQRRRERQGFATTVEGLRQQRLQGTTSLLGTLGNLSRSGTEQAENTRQFELERDDSLKFNDKSAAVNLKTGNANAAAAESAGKKGAVASGVGAAAGLLALAFL